MSILRRSQIPPQPAPGGAGGGVFTQGRPTPQGGYPAPTGNSPLPRPGQTQGGWIKPPKFNPYGAMLEPGIPAPAKQDYENEALAQNTANQAPTVRPIAGINPVRQGAYEQQAQTALEQQHQTALEGLRNQYATGQTQLGGQLQKERDLRLGDIADKADAARAKRAQDMFRSRYGMITGGLPDLGTEPPGGGGGIPADEEAARAAAFARAKDTQAQQARASIDSLRSLLSETGNLGGGAESAGIGSIIAGTSGELGELNREQLINSFGRAGQIADRNYAGALTRRGQDIGLRQSLLGLLNGPLY